jgi:hypothetical protein
LGNVFAFGMSDLDEPYPLIVKYSPSGTIEREFLSSADVPEGERATLAGSLIGQPDMFIKGGQLFVWLPLSQDLFRFSLAGDLTSKSSIANVLNGLTTQTNSDRTVVRTLTTGRSGEIFAQVQLWPKQAPDPIRTVTISIALGGSKATMLESPPGFSVFLGRTDQGKMIFYEPQPGWKGGKLSEY